MYAVAKALSQRTANASPPQVGFEAELSHALNPRE